MYCINKKEGNESLSLIGFGRNVGSPVFVKYSKEDRLSASQVENWDIPLDAFYHGRKHQKVQSLKERQVQKTFDSNS